MHSLSEIKRMNAMTNKNPEQDKATSRQVLTEKEITNAAGNIAASSEDMPGKLRKFEAAILSRERERLRKWVEENRQSFAETAAPCVVAADLLEQLKDGEA